MTKPYRDVAVVGSGPAGLAAAWALSGAGVEVTLYERRQEPGGRLRTDGLDGVRLDVAVQLLGSYYSETFRLAREAGAGDLLVRAPGRDALWRGGRAHPVRYGSVSSMALSGALSAGLKLRLASRYVPFLGRNASLLDVNEPVRSVTAGLDDESIASWGRRELGEDFVELLVYPQLAAYYGATPEETTAGFYHALAHAGMDVSVYAVRGGMGALAQALLASLTRRGVRFRGGVEARAVTAGSSGVDVEWGDGGARHDAVVLAVPGPGVAELAGLEGPAREWFAGVRTAPAASLALVLDGAAPVEYFGLSFPRTEREGDVVAAVCFQSRKGAELPGGGKGALVVYPAPSAVPGILDGSAEKALDAVLPALERALPGLRRHILRAKLYRFATGGTLFYPGYLRHLGRFDPGLLPARLAVAGDYLVAPTVEGAVRSGFGAAARLLAD